MSHRLRELADLADGNRTADRDSADFINPDDAPLFRSLADRIEAEPTALANVGNWRELGPPCVVTWTVTLSCGHTIPASTGAAPVFGKALHCEECGGTQAERVRTVVKAVGTFDWEVR